MRISNKYRFIFLLTLVTLIFPGIWVVIIVQSVGVDSVLYALNAGNQSLIFAIGAFGSSFGFPAAIFAGLAVTLLWRNLEVSQEELTQLRTQMEIDRNLTTFSKLIDLVQSTRDRARNHETGRENQKGKAVIEHYSLKLQEMRQRGDFAVDAPLDAMKSYFHDPVAPFPRNFSLAVSEYAQACREMIRFLTDVRASERQRLALFLKATMSTSDYIVLHEYFIVNTDPEFSDELLESGFFEDVGLPLRVILQSGPFFPPDVYGEKIARAVERGSL